MDSWKTAPTTFEQLTILRYKKYGSLIWAVVMFLVSIVGIIAQIYFREFQHILSSAFLGLIGVLLPLVWGWARNQLINLDGILSTFVDLEEEEISRLTRDLAYRTMTGTWVKWVCGIAIGISGFATVTFLGVPSQDHSLRLFSFIGLVPLFFFSGTGLYNYILALSVPSRLAKLPMRIPLYQDKYNGVSALNPLVFGLSVISLTFYALLFGAVVTGPYPLNTLMLGWLSVVGMLAALILPITLAGLHYVMKSGKKDALVKLSPKLEEATETAINSPTKENLEIVDALLKLRKELLDLPEWPIDFKTFITLLTTALFPAITFILDLVL